MSLEPGILDSDLDGMGLLESKRWDCSSDGFGVQTPYKGL
jgi:hypothetical protein